MSDRPTIREVPQFDLSKAIEEYYRGHFEDDGRGEVFARWLDGIRAELEQAACHRADSAFLLHVLVCTWDRQLKRQLEGNEALGRLAPKKRAQLVGGLRLLRTLGEPWLRQVLGPKDQGRGRQFLFVAIELEMKLTAGIVRTPAWEAPSRMPGKPRGPENAVTACIVCVLDELRQHPKPAAATAKLVKKAGLLRRSRGGLTGVASVARRAARARDKAKDLLGPIGNVVWLLKSSYADLVEHLLADTDGIWAEVAAAWSTTAPLYRRAFIAYCRARDLRPNVDALRHFECELSAIEQREGMPQVMQLLRNLAGSSDPDADAQDAQDFPTSR